MESAWQYLCNHCSGLYNGVWYCKNAEFCSWRCHYGRRFCDPYSYYKRRYVSVLAVLISIVFCTVLGIVIEKVAYRPLRKASSNLAVLITAIGVSYLLQNLALLIFGADAKSFVTVIDVPSLSLFGGALVIKGITIVTIVVSVIIMAALTFFVLKNKTGTCYAGGF